MKSLQGEMIWLTNFVTSLGIFLPELFLLFFGRLPRTTKKSFDISQYGAGDQVRSCS